MDTYELVVPQKAEPTASMQQHSPPAVKPSGPKPATRPYSVTGKLFLDGRETDFFFFNQDYYWMLSDNANEAVDSRHLRIHPTQPYHW